MQTLVLQREATLVIFFADRRFLYCGLSGRRALMLIILFFLACLVAGIVNLFKWKFC
jgi:hypothetical protein